MDYGQTINFLYTRLPMFSRIGAAAIKKDLQNTLLLCDLLDNPQQKFKSVHIAGTNGKGSVSHMLAAIFQKASYKTGLYTSPHLKDFRERIKIDGRLIPETAVTAFIERLQTEILRIEPSFFELTVALAFDYFASEQVDIAIIETGLGGRLDSTNVIRPELSVITNIGFDHMQLLGHTLHEIAAEKAGIIKPGVPVVIGESQEETAAVFQETAARQNAPIWFADEQFWVTDWKHAGRMLVAEVEQHGHSDRQTSTLDLPGVYQLKNLVTVLQATRRMQQQGWQLPQQAIEAGLAGTKLLTGLHGRWEIVHDHPQLVLDVAHNEAGMQALVSQLELCTYNHLHIVIGMVMDKEVRKAIRHLPSLAHYYFCQSSMPRAMPVADLQTLADSEGLQGNAHSTVMEALQAAVDRAMPNDLVLVCGSVFVIAEVNIGQLRF